MDSNFTPDFEPATVSTPPRPMGRLRRSPQLGDLHSRFAWRGVGEAVVLILVFLAADRIFGDGHRYLGLEPHPFGLAVLLVAAQYGTAEAAATSIIATAALLAFNLPEQSFDQNQNAWLQGIFRDPLLWLTTSLVLGEITGRIRQRAREGAALALRRESELGAMVQANTDLVDRVTMLETRIAGQQRTVTSIYEAARALGPGHDAVLTGALALVRAATGATRSAIYLLKGTTLVPAGSDGSEGQTDIQADSRLFEAIIGNRRCLLVNNAQDRDALGAHGLLAAPIQSQDGAVLGALVVEAIPFTQLHFGAVANFRSVCEWVGDGLDKAASYEAARQGRFLVEGSSLVAAAHADRLIGIMGATARRVGFDLTLLRLDLEHGAAMSDAGRRTLVTVLEAVLRDTDLLIEGDERSRLRVLMPGTPLRHVPLVADRLRTALASQDTALRDQVTISWLGLNEHATQELAP